MSKVIMFSRVFPAYHPRAGEPTRFVEKILISLVGKDVASANFGFDADQYEPKYHTIRKGHRFKTGEKFSPRIWSGKPYRSKHRIIAPEITVAKTWDFEMDDNGAFSINGKYIYDYATLAQNDGLTEEDMFYWFMPNYNKPKPFIGQIICWNDKIEY